MITKKIAMLGSWGVGKTSLVRQYVHQAFDEKYLSTLGVKIDKKQISHNERQINLMLWDIAGAEDNFSVPIHYVTGSAGFILVVDVTRAESLTVATDLAETIEKKLGKLPFVVLANKADLKATLSDQQVENAFGSKDVKCFKTSAKTGENVELAFDTLAKMVV